MSARKLLFLYSIIAAVVFSTGTRGHASHVAFGRGAGDQVEFSTVMVQPVGSTHFSFGFHVGGYRHYGYGHAYRGHHHGYGYGHYYRPYPYRDKYRYKYRYRHRPYYRGYYYRERHHHAPRYR